MSQNEYHWKLLVKLFLSVKDEKTMNDLLSLFFTLSETKYLADRLSIIHSLLTGELTQREIAEKMKVSIAKVTAGSNALKRAPDELKQFILNLLHKSK